MSRPKVSVVTCTYNRPALLDAAMRSVHTQTRGDLEHIVYDNGSTDPEVARVLGWWEARDSRVRVYRGETNRDQPAVFWNRMLDLALGDYFTVLDDDNTKMPNFVEVMAGVLDSEPDVDIVTCGFNVINPDGSFGYEHTSNLQTSPEVLEVRNTVDGGAMLYRREVFERVGYFTETLRTNEDWEWIRRASRVARFKNLDMRLTNYRNHDANRMLRSVQLGSDADIARMRATAVSSPLVVKVVRPPDDRLTASQRDVCEASVAGVDSLQGWRPDGVYPDSALVVAPFMLSVDEAKDRVRGCRVAVSVHVEDPYALYANLERVRAMIEACPEVWVATNDVSTVSAYREVVGDRVIVCPSLSANSRFDKRNRPVLRDVDVLLCGYAYPSRRRFVSALLPRLRDYHVVLIGDGWADSGVESYPTFPANESHEWHERAKATVCLHRVDGDCGGGPLAPRTVNRGYVEGFAGTRVFLDRSRDHYHLDEGDVVWYDDAHDCADKVRGYLVEGDASAASRFQSKCRTLYTYRTRLARVLNCVRGDRYLAEIP